MKVNVQSVGFSASNALLDFIEQKVNKLLRFEDEIEFADAILRAGNDQEGTQYAEIKLKLRNGEVFAAKGGESYEEAVDETVEALRRQLLKRKERSRE